MREFATNFRSPDLVLSKQDSNDRFGRLRNRRSESKH